MHQNLSSVEDKANGKILDFELMKRLVKYLKPYIKYVIISFLLLLLVSGTVLIRPFISKYTVDNFIVSDKNAIRFNDKEKFENFIKNHKEINFTKYEMENKYYLIFSNSKMRMIKKSTLNEVLEVNKFFNKIQLIKKNNTNLEILKDLLYEELSDELILLEQKNLEKWRKEGILSVKEIKILRKNDIFNLKIFGLIFFGLIFIEFIATYFQIYFINYASQHAMFDLRKDIFSHVSKMPLSFFDKNPVGKLVTRITNDVRTLDEMLSNGLISLIQQFFILFGIIIVLLIVNWRLALVAFSVLPFVTLLFVLFIKKTRIIYREVRKRVAKINTAFSEDISGVKIIQLFNQIERKTKKFSEINRDYYKTSLKQLRLFAFFRPLINSTRRIGGALILWYGGGQILENVMSFGTFIFFTSNLDMFFEPINRLSEQFNILQAAMSGIERIFNLTDKKPEDYRKEKIGNTKIKGEIEFKNLTMRYNKNGDILKNVSFKIKAGEKVALVGHTGSGKTSIISLLAGMYSFQKGSIKIDGKELKDYSLENIRRSIGIVQQDVFLFSGTIKDNIVLSNKNISDDEMKKVAKYVNVDKFIDKLPEKYLEPVMERGATFSVGQRQLIAFARVLAYKHVDRIIVLHKGEIKEIGTHQELLKNLGNFHCCNQLWKKK